MKKKSRKEGELVIISAPSGAGKTTIVRKLLSKGKKLKCSVSYTTRKPRKGERHGKDYFFTKRSDFLKKRSQSFFLEWANVFGELYGTSEALCTKWVKRGYRVLLTIDVQGMRKVKRRLKGKIPVKTIFIMPPSLSVLKERLTGRQTDSMAEIKKRLRIALKEMKAKREYDFVVVNRNVKNSVDKIINILKKT